MQAAAIDALLMAAFNRSHPGAPGSPTMEARHVNVMTLVGKPNAEGRQRGGNGMPMIMEDGALRPAP